MFKISYTDSKRFVTFLLVLFLSLKSCYSQEKLTNPSGYNLTNEANYLYSGKSITFLDTNEHFHYLDSRYQINKLAVQDLDLEGIAKTLTFRKPIEEWGYRDSLAVLLGFKHQGFNRGFRHEELYSQTSNKRVQQHLCIDSLEVERYMQKNNFIFYSDILLLFRSNIDYDNKQEIIGRVRERCSAQIGDEAICNKMSTEDLLNFSFFTCDNSLFGNEAAKNHRKRSINAILSKYR